MKALEPAVSLSLKNILLATDFSPVSGMAVKYAQAIARRHDSRVHTIHVTTPDSYHLLDPDAFALTFNGATTQAENIPEVLHSLLEGLPSETPLRQGTIWKVISDVVERNEIDLLIL
jgi:nucleotide-binding universal stress UspA family protein